jgi:hypothetical protein
VIQEHHARRRQFDFRLEKDGVFESRAVPNGLLPEVRSIRHSGKRMFDYQLNRPEAENIGAKVRPPCVTSRRRTRTHDA